MKRTLILSMLILFGMSLMAAPQSPEKIVKAKQISNALNNQLTQRMPAQKSNEQQMPKFRRSVESKHVKIYPWLKNEFGQPDKELTLTKGVGLTMLVNGSSDVYYISGDTITLHIESYNPVSLYFYLDNGDGIFTPEVEYPFGENGTIYVTDGDEKDETPAGDGVWEFSASSGDFSGDMPFWGVPGTVFYIVGVDETANLSGMVTAHIAAPVTDYTISGNITTETGNPLPGIIVVAFPADSIYFGPEGKEDDVPIGISVSLTDMFGNYQLYLDPTLGNASYVVMAFDLFGLYNLFPDPPYQFLYVDGNETDVHFNMIEGNGVVDGYVRDINGTPMSGLIVYCYGGMVEMEDTTDTNGYFSFNVVEGFYIIELEEDQIFGTYFVPYTQYADVLGEIPVQVEFILYPLHEGDVISGQVTNPSGTGMNNIMVFADKFPLGYTYAYTDGNGDYSVTVNAAYDTMEVSDEYGTWYSLGYKISVNFQDATYLSDPQYYYEIFTGETGIDFILFSADVHLSGFIYDATTHEGLEGAIIIVSNDSYDFFCWTDYDGSYDMWLIGGMNWTVDVYYPNYYWAPAYTDSIYLEYGTEYNQVNYWITEPVAVVSFTGLVFDPGGQRLANAHVSVASMDGGGNNYSTETDVNGYFIFPSIEGNHSYEITITYGDYEPIYDYSWFGNEDVYREYYFGGSSNVNIIVFVYDESGNPINNALVFGNSGWNYFSFFTDFNGMFDAWLPRDNYMFVAGANGYWTDTLYVDVSDQDTLKFYLQDAASALTERVSGKVFDDNYNPIPFTFIYWETSGYFGYTLSDEYGNYALDLIPGDYSTTARADGYLEEYRYWHVPSDSMNYDIMMWRYYQDQSVDLYNVQDIPDDQGKQVRLSWNIKNMKNDIAYFLIYRGISDGSNSSAFGGWDYIGTVMVHPDEYDFNFVAPTLYDKVGDDIFWTPFMVTVVGYDGWWSDSNISYGFSEDNLLPEVPYNLNLSQNASENVLIWSFSDAEPVKYFTIYRQIDSGSWDLHGYTTEASFKDADVSSYAQLSYKVTATDYGMNESGYSPTVVTTPVGVDEIVPMEFSLYQNYPNPFNPTTTIRFAVPETEMVTIEIYDALGRHISTLTHQNYQAGYHNLVWNGLDSKSKQVSSGLYFYRLTAGDFTQMNKMILMR